MAGGKNQRQFQAMWTVPAFLQQLIKSDREQPTEGVYTAELRQSLGEDKTALPNIYCLAFTEKARQSLV